MRGSLLVSALALFFAAEAQAQEPVPPDTTRILEIDPVVVTVERGRTLLARSTGSVSLLTRSELERYPGTTLADALRQVPGIFTVDLDGQGHEPQVMARGFYGGGEAEYVVVLLDGKPLNGVAGGLVRWDQIPMAAIERIEVLRGGTSALWGDAALGAVVSVITRDDGAGTVQPPQWSVSGGSHGTSRGSGEVRLPLAGRDLRLFGGLERTDGFREGSERQAGRAGADYVLISGNERELALSVLSHWRDYEEPGPLLENELRLDRRASSIFHRFDRTEEWSHRLGVDGTLAAGNAGRLSGALAGETRRSEWVRTVRLAPGFADTKERSLGTGHLFANVQLSREGALLTPGDRVVVGIDASRGSLNSEYYSVATGPPAAYEEAPGQRGSLDASGRGHRGAAALFAQYESHPVEAVRLSIGARGDWIRDRFRPEEPGGGGRVSASHSAISPKLGVNVRWLTTPTQTGHVFLTGGRSFKAPTLDQLFDQRTFPVPFPPFAVSPANHELRPQRGTHLEAGLYHSAVAAQGAVRLDLSLAAYAVDMQDELDFDLQALRYVNLGEARHRGMEAGVRASGSGGRAAFVNLALQHVTDQEGEFDGNQLKAVPRQIVDAGASAELVAGIEAGVRVSHARGIHLDDANTIELPPFTRTDLRLSRLLGGFELNFDVRNLLDARFSTTGYPDPSGSGEVYHYPAAGRTLELGLRAPGF